MDNFESARQFFSEGLQLLEANSLQAAENMFARSLELLPDRVSTLNNLSAVKLKLGKTTEAEQFARKAIGVDDQSPEAWSNLGIALMALERPEEALQACDRALQRHPAGARVWLTKAKALLQLQRYDEALRACDEALKLDSNQHESVHTRSLILKELGRVDEARKHYLKSLEMRVAMSPVYSAERRASQKGDALILDQNPELDDSLKSFELLHLYCKNFPGQLARHLQDDFHFTYVFVGDAARLSARTQIPPPDFVINNNVNGEVILGGENLTALSALADSFGVPVVNHPTQAVQTTRDVSARLLEGLPGVMVPKTVRFAQAGMTREQLVQEIEAQYDYPLIARTLTSQMGKGMTKVDSRETLAELLASDFHEEFFVTQFVDSRGGGEFHRKLRAAIVAEEIIVVRADYDTHWNVRGRKPDRRVAFYLEHAHLLEEEKRICSDPEGELGRAVIQSLRAIRDRIPLDIFGIDFGVGPDGRVVFYEANATMNLFSTARKEIPNPKEAEDCLKGAFQRYFTSLTARR